MSDQEINEELISSIINRMYSEGSKLEDVKSGIPDIQHTDMEEMSTKRELDELPRTFTIPLLDDVNIPVRRNVPEAPASDSTARKSTDQDEKPPEQQMQVGNVQESIITETARDQHLLPSNILVGSDSKSEDISKANQDRMAEEHYFLPKMPRNNGFDVERIRKDFPILHREVNGKKLIWLDNAATSQKPFCVIDELKKYYERNNSNVHRGAHALAALATDAYEDARKKIKDFIGARSTNEIVFVRGATEAVNLVAQTFGRQNVGKGDEILITELEHHANIVPWQMLAKEKGAKLLVAPIDDDGEVILEEYAKLLGPNTKIVGIGHVSNALGTVNPAKEMIEMAHKHGATVVLDGAQSVPHMRVNMQELNPDFFVFSGHKMFGPTGIGVLYGKEELLKEMPPWQGGGSMIKKVTREHTTYQDPPHKFEAGTGNIADAIGLGAAIDYLNSIGFDDAIAHEDDLLEYATRKLQPIPGVHLIGNAKKKVGVISLLIDGHNPEAIGKKLDDHGIAVRASHHCAQLVMQRFNTEATVRPSIAFYNTYEEIDKLVEVIQEIAAESRVN